MQHPSRYGFLGRKKHVKRTIYNVRWGDTRSSRCTLNFLFKLFGKGDGHINTLQ